MLKATSPVVVLLLVMVVVVALAAEGRGAKIQQQNFLQDSDDVAPETPNKNAEEDVDLLAQKPLESVSASARLPSRKSARERIGKENGVPGIISQRKTNLDDDESSEQQEHVAANAAAINEKLVDLVADFQASVDTLSEKPSKPQTAATSASRSPPPAPSPSPPPKPEPEPESEPEQKEAPSSGEGQDADADAAPKEKPLLHSDKPESRKKTRNDNSTSSGGAVSNEKEGALKLGVVGETEGGHQDSSTQMILFVIFSSVFVLVCAGWWVWRQVKHHNATVEQRERLLTHISSSRDDLAKVKFAPSCTDELIREMLLQEPSIPPTVATSAPDAPKIIDATSVVELDVTDCDVKPETLAEIAKQCSSLKLLRVRGDRWAATTSGYSPLISEQLKKQLTFSVETGSASSLPVPTSRADEAA